MENIFKDVKKVFESKSSFRVLLAIGIVVVVLLIFSAGVSVGFHKASFGQAWGENYERNFGMMASRPMFGRDNFPNGNGAVGKIIKITLPTIVVQGKENTEKVVLIKDDTKIQEMMTRVQASDLSLDDYIVVIGSPNKQGQIEAKLIRIMPSGIPFSPSPQTLVQ